jgi:hypothetical protein
VQRTIIVLLFPSATVALAQQPSVDVNVKRQDPGDEIGKLKKNCPFQHIMGCLEVLLTGQPLHVAVGSIAPQNGFGAGLAYVGHKTPNEDWRITWNADAIGSVNGSWRAGMYWKFVDTKLPDIGIQRGTKGKKKNNPKGLPEQPVIHLYMQAISLNKLIYFGLGPNSSRAGRSFYGMRETIIGTSGVKPFHKVQSMGIYGEINGRFVNIRPSSGEATPSIQQLYSDATAPGIADQPAFVQLGEGVRLWPAYKNRLLLNYDVGYRQFVAAGNSNFSFQRLTFDLNHEFRIHREISRVVGDSNTNGPDDCSLNPEEKHPQCPHVEFASNLEGSVSLRVFTALSMTPNGTRVPFYFQPTLGGADINGNPSLSSYEDYRFRAPNVFLAQEKFEHSIGKWPIGFLLSADQGKVGVTRGDLGSNRWVHSFGTGLTLRAAGFPQVYLLFAWGGNEGTHTIASLNNSLLGGAARPSLF